MLPHEIAPYAQAHIQELGKASVQIEGFMLSSDSPSKETLEEWFKAVTNASRALYRFQVCMTDEVDTKERALQACRDNNVYPYPQKADS